MSFDPFSMDEENWPPLWRALFERDFSEAVRLLKTGVHLDEIIEGDGDIFQIAPYVDGVLVLHVTNSM
jgi:hypothetical protein